ncbi:MAG: hypothetical protein OER97_08565 [Gammaproteobacteria bacterium]|nr:hypothetical protein [Gammaproteobacteria bacterium]
MQRALPIVVCFALASVGCVEPIPPIYEEPVPLSLSSGAGALGPRLTVGADKDVLLSWMERRDEGAELRVSRLGDDGWLTAADVVEDPKMFINWADFPSVTSLGDSHWIAHWLSYSADQTYSYDVLLSQSTDAGQSWSAVTSPHSDGTPTEHGFVSLWKPVEESDPLAGLVWLDGRNTVNEAGDDPSPSGMTLRAAFVDADGNLSGEQLIDELICDCCQTDVAMSSKGPIAAYRDRSPNEVRDISISRFVDGRWQLGEPFSNDGWEISACPVNGPAIAADGDLVAIAWFTAATGTPFINVRVSKNGGKEFGERVLIASGAVLGHVDVAYIGDSSFAVSWLRNGDDLHNIYVRSVTTAGALGKIRTVGRTAVSHTVPQMIARDGFLIFAWTDEFNDESILASASVEIAYAK